AKAEGDQEQEFAALKRCATQNPSAQNLSTEDPEGVVSSEQEQAAIMPGGDAGRYIESGTGAGSAIVAVDCSGRDARATANGAAGATRGGQTVMPGGAARRSLESNTTKRPAAVRKTRRRTFP